MALDDLHWADKPTLQLLQHVARDLGRGRVLIAGGNYRDTDITRQSALSETLAALNRESGFERIVLRGLTREETGAYIRAKANIEPRREVLDRIYEETEGNAFFLSEVVNLMAEEGNLSKESVSDIAIPDGVKEALGRRLNRLSPEANEMLRVATVIGREFSYDTLTLLGDRDEDALLKQIEEAIEARVIEELPQPGRYRFTHAQMHETLLAELSTTRRVRLHGQVGEALEKRYGDRAEENAARLATHFVEAAALAPHYAQKARRYALSAAHRAEKQAAWTDEVKWYEAVLDGVSDPEPEALAAYATARSLAGALGDVADWELFHRALGLFHERGDMLGLARAVARMPWFFVDFARIEPFFIAAAAAAGAEEHVELKLTILYRSYRASSLARRESSSLTLKREDELYELAIGSDTTEAAAIRHFLDFSRALRRRDVNTQSESAWLAAEAFLSIGRVEGAGFAAILPLLTSYAQGRIRLAEGLADRVESFSSRARYPGGGFWVWLHRRMFDLLRWVRRPENWQSIPAGLNSVSIACQAVWFPLLEGRMDEARSLIPTAEPSQQSMQAIQDTGHRAAVLFLTDGPGAAQSDLDRWAGHWKNGIGDDWQRSLSASAAAICLETMGDDALARSVFDATGQWQGWCGPVTALSLDTARGNLALRLALIDEAHEAFSAGLEWAEREGCPVEAGRNLQGLATVAERRGDLPAALIFLDRAAAYYQPRGIKLFLDQVIAKKVELLGITHDSGTSIANVSTAVQAERPNLSTHAAADGTVTLLFSDIENSTAQNEQMGDARWMELLHGHNAVVRRNLARFGGHEVKSMGDGFMLVFGSPGQAVRYAAETQRELAVAAGLEGVRLRMGIHTGDAVREAGDFFGREVNYAARVAGCAVGGEVVVSEAVRERLQDEFVLDPGRVVTLKGFAGEHRVYAVG